VTSIGPQKWRAWLAACIRDGQNPIEFRGSLGMLTGQDARALEAIAACWELYASSDDDGRRAALEAVRSLLRGMQPKCWPFARELIARSMEWDDRYRLWSLVTQTGDPMRCTVAMFEASSDTAGTPCKKCRRPFWEHKP
jgi:hypothetical protein